MDRPLLALTRQRSVPLGPSPAEVAADNMRQLIQLRWIAVAGQFVTILVVGLWLRVQLPLGLLLTVVLLKAWSVWVLVAIACLCFATLGVHYVPLAYPPGLLPEVADLYTLGSWMSFALVCTLLVLFSTRITRNLRARDAYVAEMRQHAAEGRGWNRGRALRFMVEAGIVRATASGGR